MSQRDEGTYECVAKNIYGEVNAFHTITRTGSAPPSPQITPAHRQQDVIQGE